MTARAAACASRAANQIAVTGCTTAEAIDTQAERLGLEEGEIAEVYELFHKIEQGYAKVVG